MVVERTGGSIWSDGLSRFWQGCRIQRGAGCARKYVAGLIDPSDRKIAQPLAARAGEAG